MRMRSVLVLCCLGILLFPVSSISSLDSNDDIVLTPLDLDSDVGVIAGDIFYYNIEELDLPPSAEIDNVTLPDFSGNQIYVKVLYVNENYQYDFITSGTAINYAVGFKFATDTTFGLDFSLLDTNLVIPKGATTPSASIYGNPHFEDTIGLGPAMFFLNNDWNSHVTELEALGFTVTDEASELSAIMFVDAGVITFTWRKSDGALTHLMIDDILFMGTDFSDTKIEISLAEKSSRPLNLAVGDQIVINLDDLDINYDVSGEIATYFNETEMNEVFASYENLVDKPLLRLTVQEVYGIYYTCSAWIIDDLETGEMVKTIDDLYFIGFQGINLISYDDLPGFNWDDYELIGSGYLPAITPDWDIYEGYMVLANTLFGVYIDVIQDILIIEEDSKYTTINTLEFSFGFDKKRDYYYYQQSMNYDIDNNMSYYYYNPLSLLDTQDVYAIGYRTQIKEQLWIAYHESGIFAGLRVKYDLEETTYDHVGVTDLETGTIKIKVDIKLRNPNYNPPDNFGELFVPGFEWLIAVPAIGLVSLITLYFQKKKSNK